ncbi:aldo/keto reductase [uncultured Psychrobacter sp.]|jgi:aryl-alcohol dehydrogenase-like predicted oxidoreductase|uniref:aldo/keto reductase n=1 Tax=uncultured Psychrobacter sp. TaxID=259303 RepID=UPI00260E6DCF|nr:aldo/keto reductase [uncultured Psychrobacter sp.]
MNNNRQKLILGTVQFGQPYGVANPNGQVPKDDLQQILEKAHQLNITTLDTAIAYGESEKVLGQQDLQDFKVISKLFKIPDNCSDITDWVEQQVQGSLARLQVDSLEGLLLHRPAQLLGNGGQELYQAIQCLKARGVVKRIGLSMYGYEELHDIIDNIDADFDIIQAPMNLFDRRLDSSGLLKKLKNRGIEVHARSAFLQGLLLMSKENIPSYFAPWQDKFDSYHQWLSINNISALEACLGYLNQHPDIDKIVVGVDSLAQLNEIATAMDAQINAPPLDIQSVDEGLINPSRWQLWV